MSRGASLAAHFVKDFPGGISLACLVLAIEHPSMHRRLSFFTLSLAAFVAGASSLAPSVASACGGCFAPPAPTPESAQIVTDHRMVLALSQRQTTLWDQIRYTGAPEDFVWVLPVANAATLQIGLADNAFVDALDTYTAPFITAELPQCWRRFQFVSRFPDSGAFIGCGASESGGFGAMPGVESTRVGRDGEAVVGPYAVTVLSTDSPSGGMRLDAWLAQNGYQIPASTRSAIDHYVDLQFDFIILRLRPGAGVKQMQPVRITTRGYMPMLPLRMIVAGIGDKVGLALTVISAGRVEAQSFANEVLDERRLSFNFRTNTSNWRTEYQRLLSRRPGRTWVIESVQNMLPSQLTYGGSAPPQMPPPETRTLDASMGDGSSDSAAVDASDDVSLVLDADRSDGPSADGLVWDGAAALDGFGSDVLIEPDSSASDSGANDGAAAVLEGGMMMPAWEPYIDRRYAFAGLDGRSVVTRMRTELRFSELDGDLVLDGSSGPLVPVEYIAPNLENAPSCPRTSTCAVVGGAAPLALEALGITSLVLVLRRRRRKAVASHK